MGLLTSEMDDGVEQDLPSHCDDLNCNTILQNLTDEDIYEACIQYVKEFFCYGSKFVKQMTLTEIDNGIAFHYILESFVEKRETVVLETPYYGQLIDGPENGRAPGPWDVIVRPSALFQNGQVRVEIPHTAYVTECRNCGGNGRVRCNFCFGRGTNMCVTCSGTGRKPDGVCFACSGLGHTSCWKCSGMGRVVCTGCTGHGRIKCCKIVNVTWTNHLDDFVSNESNLPTDLIEKVTKVTGNKTHFEESERVTAIVDAPHESINVVSAQLIKKHGNSFPHEFILRQRHTLRVVPLTKVKYQWKNKQGEFYVYGQERKVFFQDYPQKCCCCTCL